LFTAGAQPPNLPGGNQPGVLFVSDLAFDSGSGNRNGINYGETARFRFTGAGVQDFASGLLDGGVHVRSLASGRSESLVTVSAVPEPETYAMMLAGLGLMGAVARRRKAKQA
jgi:PEP-CTERM motif